MGTTRDDLQAAVVKGRFGLTIDTTDGEYYGAGMFPTAYKAQPKARESLHSAVARAAARAVKILKPLGGHTP